MSALTYPLLLLGYPDSNQERQDQNLQCYHYTIPQCPWRLSVISDLRVQRYYFFLNHQNFSGLFYKKTQKKFIHARLSDKNHYLCSVLTHYYIKWNKERNS